ncbi:hypothetical protein JOQ06_017774, partial [Pogonophryne albipinna]
FAYKLKQAFFVSAEEERLTLARREGNLGDLSRSSVGCEETRRITVKGFGFSEVPKEVWRQIVWITKEDISVRPIKAARATQLRKWEWVHVQGPSAKCLRGGGLSGCGSLCGARRLQVELRDGGGVYDQLKQGGGDPSRAPWGHLWNRLTNGECFHQSLAPSPAKGTITIRSQEGLAPKK